MYIEPRFWTGSEGKLRTNAVCKRGTTDKSFCVYRDHILQRSVMNCRVFGKMDGSLIFEFSSLFSRLDCVCHCRAFINCCDIQ